MELIKKWQVVVMLGQLSGKEFLLNMENGKARVLLWTFIQSQVCPNFIYPTTSTNETKTERNLIPPWSPYTHMFVTASVHRIQHTALERDLHVFTLTLNTDLTRSNKPSFWYLPNVLEERKWSYERQIHWVTRSDICKGGKNNTVKSIQRNSEHYQSGVFHVLVQQLFISSHPLGKVWIVNDDDPEP